MTPRIPIELRHARHARAEAWKRYDEAIERGEPHALLDQYGLAAEICDAIASRIYNKWQALGGTSDIDCLLIADPRSPAEADLDQWQTESQATRLSDYPI